MHVKEKFTVLEDGETIGVFDTYGQAVDYLGAIAVKGGIYQVVKKFFSTDEKPRQTVADTGWKDEYRCMWAESAGAENPFDNYFLMLAEDAFNVRCLDNNLEKDVWWLKKDSLIPRYDLAPVRLTTYPAYLETLEDYQNAPENTIVGESRIPDQPFVAKYGDGKEEWVNIWGVERMGNDFLAGVRRKVLYWPEDSNEC